MLSSMNIFTYTVCYNSLEGRASNFLVTVLEALIDKATCTEIIFHYFDSVTSAETATAQHVHGAGARRFFDCFVRYSGVHTDG